MVKEKRSMSRQREAVGVFRVALDSISPRWAGWGLTAHAVLTLGGSIWGVQHAIVSGGHETAYDLYLAIGMGVIRAFGMSLATVVTTAEVIDTIMVIAHFVGQKMKQEGREEGLAEGREKGLAEGRKEGRAEGRAEVAVEVNEKVNRLLEAHPELKDEIEALRIHEENSGEG